MRLGFCQLLLHRTAMQTKFACNGGNITIIAPSRQKYRSALVRHFAKLSEDGIQFNDARCDSFWIRRWIGKIFD